MRFPLIASCSKSEFRWFRNHIRSRRRACRGDPEGAERAESRWPGQARPRPGRWQVSKSLIAKAIAGPEHVRGGRLLRRLRRRHALRLLWSLGMLAAAAAACPAVKAQTFPERTVKLIVPVPPGGSTDAIARLVTARMQAILGQPV